MNVVNRAGQPDCNATRIALAAATQTEPAVAAIFAANAQLDVVVCAVVHMRSRDVRRLREIVRVHDAVDRLDRAELDLAGLVAEQRVVVRRGPVLAHDEVDFPVSFQHRE